MGATKTVSKPEVSLDLPWNVVVHDDPVNLMGYVTWVFMKVFSYPKSKAEVLMMEVHQAGKSIVWTGQQELAELYTHQLQAFQLRTTMEKSSS